MMRIGIACWIVGVVLVTGCGAASVDEVAPRLEGIYAVETWTLNEEGCNSEGPSFIDQLQETRLVLAIGKARDQSYLEVVSCGEPTDCEAKAEAIPKRGNYVAWHTFTLTEAKSVNSLHGEVASTGFVSSDSDVCTGGELADHSLEDLGDGKIRIEVKTRIVDYPQDESGYCTTQGTIAAAKDKACNQLQVVTASRLGE